MTNNVTITSEELLKYWQEHRRLTRRVLEAVPEDKFETYSIGGMRTPSGLALELLAMGATGLKGLLTNEWKSFGETENDHPGANPHSKDNILIRWDAATEEINALWPRLTPQRFRETVNIFNAYEGTVLSSFYYFVDNEIHHRAQIYVYLRSLGIEPPPFWDREPWN